MPERASAVSAQDAASLLVRCEGDPEFLRQLRLAYTGRHDILDALLWRAHPLRETTGAPDPAAGLSALKARAYARDPGPLVDTIDADGQRRRVPESRLRLQELELALAEDARALDSAVQRVAADERAAEQAALRASEGAAAEHPGAEDDDDQSAFWPRLRRLARRPLAWVVAVFAVAALVVGGALIHVASTPPPDPSIGLAIFDRPAGPLDVSPVSSVTQPDGSQSTESPFDLASTRSLGSAYGWRVWAVRGPNRVCLLLATSSSNHWRCVTTETFKASGVNFILQRSDIHDADIPEGTVLNGNVQLSWGPDKKFSHTP